jgi:hypothetical protein
MQLTVVHTANDWGEGIVGDFWRGAFRALRETKLLESFPGIDQQPRFHVRFSGNTDCRGRYLELVRLNGDAADMALARSIASSVERADIISASWCPTELPRSNRFLTFLQACSVLRVERGVSDPRNLFGFDGRNFDECEQCREAYRVLREPDQPWSNPLQPWFEHLDAMHGVWDFRDDNRFEYGHWFGHIISRRGLDV